MFDSWKDVLEYLRARKKQLGLQNKDICELMGGAYKPITVSEMLTGIRVPSLHNNNLLKLMDVLKLTKKEKREVVKALLKHKYGLKYTDDDFRKVLESGVSLEKLLRRKRYKEIIKEKKRTGEIYSSFEINIKKGAKNRSPREGFIFRVLDVFGEEGKLALLNKRLLSEDYLNLWREDKEELLSGRYKRYVRKTA